MNKLENELLEMIYEVCRLQGEIPELDPAAPLIGPEGRLGIDSLDAVEIVFTVQKRYGVRIDSEETSREVLASISALAAFIERHQVS